MRKPSHEVIARQEREAKILAALANGPMTTPQIEQAVRHDQLYNTLSDMCNRGVLQKAGGRKGKMGDKACRWRIKPGV